MKLNTETVRKALYDSILWNESLMDSVTYLDENDNVQICEGMEGLYNGAKKQSEKSKALLGKLIGEKYAGNFRS